MQSRFLRIAKSPASSLLLAIAGFVSVGIVSNLIKVEGEPRLKLILTTFSACCLVWCTGAVFAVITYRSRPPVGHVSARILALCGLILNLFLLGCGLIAIFLGDRKAEMQAENVLPSRPAPAPITVSSRDKQSIANASQTFGNRSSNLLAALMNATATLTNPPILDLASVSNIGDLHSRVMQVSNFIESSKSLRDFYERAPLIYKDLLASNGVAPELQKAVTRSQFNASWKANRTQIVKMRNLEIERGKYYLKALSLLETNWDGWHWDSQEDPNLEFDDEDIAIKYYETVKVIYRLYHEQQDIHDSFLQKLRTNRAEGTNLQGRQ
jgi:hypothetical protein